MKNPGDCADMAQLRDAIDVLDTRLVALLAVRQSYMDRAAVLKTARDQVRDPARIEDVVTKVLAQAGRAGLSAAIAEPVWRTLIEQSIRHEFEKFDQRRDADIGSGETRLATYGSLQPGQVHHHRLADLKGRWLTGTVRGTLVEEGWGASLGFPGLVLDPDGAPVAVQLFQSADLPAHWPRLDAFEGDGYRRVTTMVQTEDGPLSASIYVLA